MIVTATKEGLAVRIDWEDGIRSYSELIPIAEAESLFYALLPLFQLREIEQPPVGDEECLR